MTLGHVVEGMRIAVQAIRADRLRAALAIAGIGIGIGMVVLMSALIGGVRGALLSEVSSAGVHNFTVNRWDRERLQLTSDPRELFGANPKITLRERDLLAALPSVESVTPHLYSESAARLGSRSIRRLAVFGRGADWPVLSATDFTAGRNFLPQEEQRSAAVAVLSGRAAAVLGEGEPLVGRDVRIQGQSFRVVGIFEERSAFGEGEVLSAVIPITTMTKRLRPRDDFLFLTVVPSPSLSQAVVIDEVTTALRAAHGLRPSQDNDFFIGRNDALDGMFTRWTTGFFLVMLLLSSIGLVVGGVGVVAIMTISVTERTREIGVRRALGATRREIRWQFLVEAVTLTMMGAALGLAVGVGGALLLAAVTPVPVASSPWALVAALAVAGLSGVGFGFYPARQASLLDPVDALRYE